MGAERGKFMSCIMIVRDADEWTAKYHDRMQSFMRPEHFFGWMNGEAGKGILRESPPQFREWIVTTQVSKSCQGDDDPATTIGPSSDSPAAL
jgi:putative SOS response-associated peptidase YedK